MALDDEMREQIIVRASTGVLREMATKKGLRPLRQTGLMSIFDGISSIEEVVRETVVSDM